VFATVPTKNPPNAFAAMPSEHVAWSVWALVAVLVAARALWRRRHGVVAAAAVTLAVVHLGLMVLVILATGHHYLLDVLAGGLDLAVGVALAVVGHDRWRRWRGPGQASRASSSPRSRRPCRRSRAAKSRASWAASWRRAAACGRSRAESS
jgi:hypothetical protein